MSAGSQRWPGPSESGFGPALTPTRPAPPVPDGRVGGDSSVNMAGGRPLEHDPAAARVPTSSELARKLASSLEGADVSPRTIVRRGWVSVKEDGLRAWLWSKKWLVLREHSLALYKNEGAPTAPSTTIELADVTGVAREDLKPFCIAVTTAARPYYLALKSDEELYAWMDDIYARSPLNRRLPTSTFEHTA